MVSKKVYIAPSGFLAFVDRGHPKHAQAEAFFRFFAESRYSLFTDTVNVFSSYEKIKDDIGPALSRDFLRGLMLSNVNIIYHDESDTKAAIRTLTNYRSPELTFPEALMAVLCDRRGISQICTLDYLHPLFGLQVFYLPI